MWKNYLRYFSTKYKIISFLFLWGNIDGEASQSSKCVRSREESCAYSGGSTGNSNLIRKAEKSQGKRRKMLKSQVKLKLINVFTCVNDFFS